MFKLFYSNWIFIWSPQNVKDELRHAVVLRPAGRTHIIAFYTLFKKTHSTDIIYSKRLTICGETKILFNTHKSIRMIFFIII